MQLDHLKSLVDARLLTRDGNARAIREGAGVTMAQVAEAVGVGESTVSRWESGSRQPRGDALIRWARVLAELERATEPKQAAA